VKPALTALLLALLAISSSLAADPFENDYSWMKIGENVYADQVYIHVEMEYAPLNIRTEDGIVSTGIPSLDAIASAFGIYSIEKTYYMKESPKDPTKVDLSRFYTVRFPSDFGPVPLIEAFERCIEIEYSEWIPIDRQFYTPNDPRLDNQWHLEKCDFETAWDISHGNREIVIGIVDSGLDMEDEDGFAEIHEDIEANLWVNPGEDLNGNGIVDWDEWNDEDDDENGFVDDFYGWDMTRRDNWPHDVWAFDREGGHGTHVGGTASQVTDNEIGCAGAGFNCSLMYTACYSNREAGFIQNGYAGIEYCVNNGAQIVNCSWGSYVPYNNSNRAVFRYADEHDVAVFAGCGNGDEDGNPVDDQRENRNHFYPAAFDEVIGVSASNNRDGFAAWATYGDFVDLVAPGEGILQSFPHNAYRASNGTSFSSPLTAGLAALYLSEVPDLTPDELLEAMQLYSTDISEQNQDWNGIRYRINAGYLIGSTRPKLDMVNWSLREIEGNGDRWPEPGETFAVDFTLENMETYSDAEGVNYLFETDDETIVVNDAEGSIGDIENGNQLRVTGDDSPEFTVGESEPHYSSFSITFSTENFEDWSVTHELELTLGHPAYMLVDDDGGEHYQTYYANDLSAQSYVHDTWNVAERGYPGGLNTYEYVLWITGNNEAPLSESDQDLITSYLDNGGSLIISGQYIGDAHGDSEFHRNYLHANHTMDDADEPRLWGVEGNSLTDGVSLLLIGGNGGGNGRRSPSAMEPINGAETILTYDTDNGETGAVFYDGDDYKVVYFGFALEAASGLGGTTPRVDLIQALLSDMGHAGVDNHRIGEVPQQFTLSSAYPNPFNSSTTVNVSVPSLTPYELGVYSIDGRLVSLLHSGVSTVGTNKFMWNAGDVSTGVYFIRLNADNRTLTQKVVMIQ